MKIARVIFACTCVTLAYYLIYAEEHHASSARALQRPFDSYGDISWEDEKAHLDNFAVTLRHDPDLVGYIIIYAGQRACAGEAQYRARRAKKYLVETRGLQENRVRYMDGGYREELTTILQPIPHSAPKLTASPTLKPDDVVIKNCGPKPPKRKRRAS